ncbi:hypothetical protein HID58_013132, partial [Brassica napus]
MTELVFFSAIPLAPSSGGRRWVFFRRSATPTFSPYPIPLPVVLRALPFFLASLALVLAGLLPDPVTKTMFWVCPQRLWREGEVVIVRMFTGGAVDLVDLGFVLRWFWVSFATGACRNEVRRCFFSSGLPPPLLSPVSSFGRKFRASHETARLRSSLGTSSLAQVTTTMDSMVICSTLPSCYRRHLLGFEDNRGGDSLALRWSSLSPCGYMLSRRVMPPFVLHALVQSSDKIDFVLFHGFCCILCVAWALYRLRLTVTRASLCAVLVWRSFCLRVEIVRLVGRGPPPAELRDVSQALPSMPARSHFGEFSTDFPGYSLASARSALKR